ncbi:hypothetical protein P2G88_05735 [Aliiglaciecola sp. CAU 1673]|uniref:hypothetical protein n=1 Tax=Aliiglaciecola sp. CAU 1673 TaxID=3032595 RepID=UPI0023D9D4DD|nr:hypothetical protein [Aliiglaciecola sp. CAU 1673]MDF2177745.1 hypothetical protein [Aliiglaciecola sp. CAU 1673]
MIKYIYKFALALAILALTAYYGSAFILPSVTVENSSTFAIEEVRVELPSSGLNFGSIEPGQRNTLHYSLKQAEGVYQYQIKFKEAGVVKGTCAQVSDNQFHKRMLLEIKQADEVRCHNQST